MDKISRWSKQPYWHVAIVDKTTPETFEDGPEHVESLLAEMRGVAHDLVQAFPDMQNTHGQHITDIWWYLTNELCGGDSDRIAFDETDFYKGGTLHEDLHHALIVLTEQGYDVRPHWRELRSMYQKIWLLLPEMYAFLAEQGIEDHDYKPADYDPDKPFPQYPIPTDIDE